METRSRGEPVPHVTGPQQCHTAHLQNHRPLRTGQSACYRHLGSLPTWREGQRKANGAVLSWVQQGAPQAALCTWGAVQGHGGPCTPHSGPACLRPGLRRVRFTNMFSPFHFSTLDFCFLPNFTESSKISCPRASVRVLAFLSVLTGGETKHSRTEDIPLCHLQQDGKRGHTSNEALGML